MALIRIFEIRNKSYSSEYKSVDREKIKIIMNICAHTIFNKNKDHRLENAGHKSEPGQPVKPCSTSGTLFLLFVQQTVKTLQE